jgi:poly(hydroxyalkanoate) depolymerase family esterase
MNETLRTLMRDATRLTQAGRLNEATQALQQALAGRAAPHYDAGRAQPFANGTNTAAEHVPGDPALILDGCVFETSERTSQNQEPQPQPGARHEDGDKGAFTSASYSHVGLTRRYKLYVPPLSAGRPQALIVMLHGCTQDSDDFAAGTNMNALARAQGFMVLYPEQSRDANPQRCWNWFKHNHQRRGSGEPALIASLSLKLVQEHGIDPRRVYIAGLSAGGAMAAIVATTYPEVFAAVGVHSGLPAGVAGNVAEAMALMQSGGARRGGVDRNLTAQRLVPTIVFHGDQDHTVHPKNGEQVIAATLASQTGDVSAGANAANSTHVEQGVSPRGKRYTRSIYTGASGVPLAEHWLVHGAGHAWSGGLAEGSYTDPNGPDASREMLRFFVAQSPGHTH